MKLNRNLLPGLFLFLFLVLLASLVMYLSQQPPNSLPASAPPAEFSAERAFRHVEALAHEPRPVGTGAYARARLGPRSAKPGNRGRRSNICDQSKNECRRDCAKCYGPACRHG